MTYKIVSKYIKDLSFEIAGAKAYFLLEKNIKNFLVNFEKEFEKKEMEKIILVEVPKTVYPEIRETLCYLFEKSGFKNVNLQKEINFEKLYENKKS